MSHHGPHRTVRHTVTHTHITGNTPVVPQTVSTPAIVVAPSAVSTPVIAAIPVLPVTPVVPSFTTTPVVAVVNPPAAVLTAQVRQVRAMHSSLPTLGIHQGGIRKKEHRVYLPSGGHMGRTHLEERPGSHTVTHTQAKGPQHKPF